MSSTQRFQSLNLNILFYYFIVSPYLAYLCWGEGFTIIMPIVPIFLSICILTIFYKHLFSYTFFCLSLLFYTYIENYTQQLNALYIQTPSVFGQNHWQEFLLHTPEVLAVGTGATSLLSCPPCTCPSFSTWLTSEALVFAFNLWEYSPCPPGCFYWRFAYPCKYSLFCCCVVIKHV